MAGGNKNIKPEDGKQFSSTYQPPEKWTEEKALELGNELIDWLKAEERNVFFQEFLCIKNDYYPPLIEYLSNKFSSFLKLIEAAKKIQEIRLVKLGVFDETNANMTKFVLANNHNYTEKHDHTSKGQKINNEEKTVIEFVNARKKDAEI